MTTKYRRDGNPGPIQLSDKQLNPSLAKPQDFPIQPWDTTESVTGQESDSQEAAEKSNAKVDTGSNYNDAPERP